jgi:NADH-quinone oxidoreductase subunit C
MLPEQAGEIPVVAALEAAQPGCVVSCQQERGELTLEISPPAIAAVCRFLKETHHFVRLADLTAVDWHPQEPRFRVVYHLHSVERNERLRLVCRLPGEAAEIDSVVPVWRGADWYEREVFDLFGIVFRGHPNLRRIMMPEDWEGHPLRKDYPVYGEKYRYKEQ